MRVGFIRWVLCVTLALAVSSCGRFRYTEFSVDEVEVVSTRGTLLPPGGWTELELVAQPGPFVEDTYIELTLELGRLRVGDSAQETVTVPIAQNGTMPTITAIIPLNVEPGRILELTSSVPLVGDVRLEVREPVLEPQMAYEVHEGFEVDAPITVDPAMLAGRAAGLAVARAESAFGEGLYVALGGPPALLRDEGGALVPFLETTDPDRLDDRTHSVAFPLPDAGYGDVAYLCTSNTDGVLAVTPEGTSTPPVATFPCSGLVFDHNMRLDYDVPFESPLYFTDTMGRIGRADSEGRIEILGEGLPTPPDGLRLRVCPKDFLSASTILLSTGAPGLGSDGEVMHVSRLIPYEEPSLWLGELAEPLDVAFTKDSPWGWLMFVALAGSDEVIAVRRDGSTLVLLRGLAEPSALLLIDGELWILGRGHGELVRIRPRMDAP